MKKILILSCIIALLVFFSCMKENTDNNGAIDNKVLIDRIFKAGMAWNHELPDLKSTYPVDISVDKTIEGPEGGNIHLLGSITGSMNQNDQTNEILDGTLLLGLTETINGYSMFYDGKKFVLSGAPFISLTGTFTLLPGGITFGTASSMHVGGGIRITGPNYDKTADVNVTINIKADGRGGDVSGKIGGETVNFSF